MFGTLARVGCPNIIFLPDLASIFIWHVYWPYKVPHMAITFCKWILIIKKVIHNDLKVKLLTFEGHQKSYQKWNNTWGFRL